MNNTYKKYNYEELRVLQEKIERNSLQIEDLEEKDIDKLIDFYKIQIEEKLDKLKSYRKIINEYKI